MTQHFKNIQTTIVELIENSKVSLKISVTWFTNHEIFNAIIKKFDIPSFKVSLIVLNDRINNKQEGLDFQKLIDLNCNFYYSSIENMVHHKFCIIDDQIVVTGSYNWTYYAENRNWENIVVIDNQETVNGYLEEFERIVAKHSKISNAAISRKLDISLNNNDYLTSDYLFQARRELETGNNLIAAKLLTEILKLNPQKKDIQEERQSVIQKINQSHLNFCPFEIGLLFNEGYERVIPSFSPIPFSKTVRGLTPSNNATSLEVTIQKYDVEYQNILLFTLDHLKPRPAHTVKIEYTLTIDQNGFLTILGKELNGYNRSNTNTVSLKPFM